MTHNVRFPSQSTLTPFARGWTDPQTGSHCVIAIERIPRGQFVAQFGGVRRTYRELDPTGAGIEPNTLRLTLQVDEDTFLVSTRSTPADWINHACGPNAGLRGPTLLTALRDIDVGEEITFDYATSDGSAYDEFECQCGHRLCRGRVTGEDWRLPELWARYDGHFSPYLTRRIARLRSAQTVSGSSLASSP